MDEKGAGPDPCRRKETDMTLHEEDRQFDAAAWAIIGTVFAVGLVVGIAAGILLLA